MLKRKIFKILLNLSKLFRSRSYMKRYNQYLRASGVDVKGTIKYIHPSVYLDMGYSRNIHIGDNCVISVNSVVLAHDYSIECGMTSLGKGDLSNEKKFVKDVFIGNNVFLGAGVVILPGTCIGDNCIIGAGTVCSGNIPEDSVVVGEKWRIVEKTTEWTKKKIEAQDVNILS